MIRKSISAEGVCVIADQCFPLENAKLERRQRAKTHEDQIEWIHRHTNLFWSEGRLYAKILLHRWEGVYIMDAITGTLFNDKGSPVTNDCTLCVSLKNVITKKDKIMQLMKSKYGVL